MPRLETHLVPALSDNYIHLVVDPVADRVMVVDPAEAGPVDAALAAIGRDRLHLILNTHHHGDHVGGNAALKARHGCPVIGPKADAHRIPSLDHGIADGDDVDFAAWRFRVIETPGHTVGHVAYHCAEAGLLFCGDTLFALGCGRMFEGTPRQFWSSLDRLRQLPGATKVHCGHEYTQSNARFALSIEPQNAALVARSADITARRQRGEPTVPSTIEEERATNPFLRADVASVQAAVGLAGADPIDVFAALRRGKDSF